MANGQVSKTPYDRAFVKVLEVNKCRKKQSGAAVQKK